MKKRIFSLLLALCLVAGMLPTVAYAYNNTGTIDSGTFDEAVTNSGTINGGTFNNTVTNTPGSYINNGTFNGIVNIYGGGRITGGTFNNTVNNDASGNYILGGTFYGTVNNNSGAKIQGGVFNGTVNNNSLSRIQDGTFYGTVNNNDDSYITGGTFYDKVTNGYQISGGTFYDDVENNKGNITGGTFYGTITGSGTVSGATYRRIVTFDSNGGSEVPSQDILKDSTASEPTAPTRAGYSFEGWYQGDTKFDFANTPVTEDITLTAKWTVVWTELTKDILESTYKVTTQFGDYYSLPSGHYYLGKDILVDKVIYIGTLSTPANVVLDLNGYELKNDTNIAVVLCPRFLSSLTLTDNSSDKTGTVTSNSGRAVKISPNCTLNANGGTVNGKIENDGVIDNTAPSNVTVFTGSVDNYGAIKGGTFYGTITGNGTVPGVTYRRIITFDSNGGSEVPSQDILKDSTATEPTAPTKAGYSFEGWYNGNTRYDFSTTVTENITLSAKWVEKSNITFNTTPQSYTYNGATQAFSITGTAFTDFDIAYELNGNTVVNPTDAGSYDVIITRAEDNTYKAVNETISNGLVIEPATPTENPAKKTTARVIKGKTLADAVVTNGEILGVDGTTPLMGTFAWADSAKVMSADGTEQMVFTPESANYTPITIDAAVSTYSSGGGSSTPTYAPTVTQPENGSVTVSPKSPRKGVTVTITPTPYAGYTVEQVLVTDKNGDAVEVINNGDGTYSFTQPAGKVNINVTFMEDNSMLNFFVDVFPGDYYYDAVLWAAENGITGGVDDTHFAPNAPCTRAQIVTFLWRAAGCPEPETMSSFADVPADSYYAKAVAWAVENGITTGTGDGTTFSPNATCTRAQAMAFIWRSEQAQGGGMQGAWMFLNPFEDVNLESYYGEAVMWAVANGVTNGTSDTTFSPGADCTRAQIVTFLWRALAE